MASRRKFLQAVAGGALMARTVQAAKQAGGAPVGSVPKGKYKIPAGARVSTRKLGRTGADVSIVGLGGYHLGLPPEHEAIRMVQRALDQGMNFLDNCWDYNGGESERRMGKALRDGYRSKAFVMTKLDGRTAKSASEQLEQSLERLQTDVIDLVQIHEVIRPDDPEKCFAPGGTIEALVAAHYRSFERDVMPVALKDGVAVLGMKPMGAGLILQSGAATAEECLRYAMSVPGVNVTITGCDSEGVLEQALYLATNFKPMTPDERRALLERTRPAAQGGKWEKFKTTQQFDGTEQNKHWLTSARL